ncbi:MAG: hypothetical protein IJY69_03600 [Clostridia bacterium]|nr:hypothetical protein [Clostridia bacterium]
MNKLLSGALALLLVLAMVCGAICSCVVNTDGSGGQGGAGEQGGSGESGGEGSGSENGGDGSGGQSGFFGDDDSDDEILTDDADFGSDPYVGMTSEEFYENYTPAVSYMDAYYRTQHGFLSGMLELPESAPQISECQPANNGMLVRNTDMIYLNGGKTYVVCDANGEEVFRVHKGAAYITLEEIAAYMFAFGGSNSALPANYTSAKKPNPVTNKWGIYVRGNHSYFSGDTERYPREPELPNIKGCGGSLQYYEMDIGTRTYNNGNKINRGACRIVYGRTDLNGNGKYEAGELHLFYTYNHYDDFQEYLNYYQGWGSIFGYESRTPGSTKPSQYVPVCYYGMADYCAGNIAAVIVIPWLADNKRYV